MEEAVLAGQDVDERPELGDVHDPAGVLGAEVRGRRVEDELDPTAGFLDGRRFLRADRDRPHGAVVGHRDVGAGLLGDGVDDLALRPDDLADLVDGDLEADDLGCGRAHVVAGGGDRAFHDVEDRQPGLFGLVQRSGEHVGGQPVDLGVELQRGDELAGSGDLEVHVAERVFGAEDVGEGRVFAFGVDQTHRDAGHRRLDRHAGVHEAQRRAAHRRHRGRAVRGEHVGDDPQRVGPFLGAGDHGHEGSFGQRAVPDLAAFR